jgi:mannose-6-phosphate isomerase-like protein (cupin superfamily)
MEMHVVRNIKDSDPKQITCGVMRELTSFKDFKDLNFIHVTIRDSTQRHYHKKQTEAYYVLKGTAEMEVDDKKETLTEGSLIMIFPNSKHKATKISEEDVEVLVASTPSWTEGDEFLVE